MTALNRLAVSLTKHGAHKIAVLLRKYDSAEILKHLRGSEPGINIESAQAKKNLSANRSGVVPDLWDEIRQKGSETIDAMVLVAIIFSHHLLISAIRNSADRSGFAGTVKRNQFTDEKAFTNLAHTIEMLGYSTEHSKNHVRYDFHKLFQITGLHTLFERLLRLKLIEAKWDQKNSIIEEAVSLGIHEVVSLRSNEFEAWLTTGSITLPAGQPAAIEDPEFFSVANDDGPNGKFEFRPGHNAKKTGIVPVNASKEPKGATLLHNKMQNQLYDCLVAKYGKECVGSEVATGNGTAIDVVVKTADFCWFYEIKTAASVKASIRQAIPQLLEYAYWHGKSDRADKLIIVATKKLTPQAGEYLKFLRNYFRLNIHYEQLVIA